MPQERSYLFALIAVCAVVAGVLAGVGFLISGWWGVVLALGIYFIGIPFAALSFIAALATYDHIMQQLREH